MVEESQSGAETGGRESDAQRKRKRRKKLAGNVAERRV